MIAFACLIPHKVEKAPGGEWLSLQGWGGLKWNSHYQSSTQHDPLFLSEVSRMQISPMLLPSNILGEYVSQDGQLRGNHDPSRVSNLFWATHVVQPGILQRIGFHSPAMLHAMPFVQKKSRRF